MTKDDWISVKDKLPDKDGRYLVQCDMSKKYGHDQNGLPIYVITIFTYFADERCWKDDCNFNVRNVVAWQPLPEKWEDPDLPKEGDYGYYDGEKWVKIKYIEVASDSSVDIEGLGDVRYTTTIYPESGKPMVVTIPRNTDDTVYINRLSKQDTSYILMETSEKTITITLDYVQSCFLKDSLQILLSALGKMGYDDRLMKYRDARKLISMLDEIKFCDCLKFIRVKITETVAEAICHAMHSVVQMMYGMGSSESHEHLKEHQKSILEQIYNKFEDADSNIQDKSSDESL